MQQLPRVVCVVVLNLFSDSTAGRNIFDSNLINNVSEFVCNMYTVLFLVFCSFGLETYQRPIYPDWFVSVCSRILPHVDWTCVVLTCCWFLACRLTYAPVHRVLCSLIVFDFFRRPLFRVFVSNIDRAVPCRAMSCRTVAARLRIFRRVCSIVACKQQMANVNLNHRGSIMVEQI